MRTGVLFAAVSALCALPAPALCQQGGEDRIVLREPGKPVLKRLEHHLEYRGMTVSFAVEETLTQQGDFAPGTELLSFAVDGQSALDGPAGRAFAEMLRPLWNVSFNIFSCVPEGDDMCLPNLTIEATTTDPAAPDDDVRCVVRIVSADELETVCRFPELDG